MNNINQYLLFSPLVLNLSLTIFCILNVVPTSYCNDYERYVACSRPYMCGSLTVRYPFWGNNSPIYCGRQGFELRCLETDQENYSTIEMVDQSFRVLDINISHQIMTITSADLCALDRIFLQTPFDHNLFSYTPLVRNLSLYYNCSGEFLPDGKNRFSCGQSGHYFYTIDGESRFRNLTNTCKGVVKVPFLQTPPSFEQLSMGELNEVLKQGFEVRYQIPDNESCGACSSSNGICGTNNSSNEFACLCHDRLRSRTCPSGGRPNLRLRIGLVLGAAMITACIIICILRWKKISSILSTVGSRKITKSDQDLEAFIRNYGPLALKRYSFSDVKKMTNSFKHKIGQGGYGGVYKGKLSNGRLVAVKLLNTSKGNGREFMNEVASISRTSHVNVVSLLGFCLEGSKRALIYEFLANGSLEKFIHNGNTSKASQHLEWEKMCQIVIGIARGLEYLHRGCNTRILHFDIKPHNILLDEDFCPKISDFGLAKLCLKKESIVSMLEARGTIGYIAPEVFNRNFGEVSHKSDVYSYGMMILELVGCRNNIDSGVDHTSEIYFPHWIYRHFELGKEFKLPGIATNEESEIAKKMIIVGLWCIQIRPSDRPSIDKVVEMLHGSIETLHIPPMPFLSSPPRLAIHSSSTSVS